MLCTNPFTGRGAVFGCGQCKCCRINRTRQKTARQILESYAHEENCFVTLTYNDEHCPKDFNLNPAEMKLWMYRIRKALQPVRVRFCLVGEYGHAGSRLINPHYHANLFGVGPLTPVRKTYFAQLVQESWPFGFTMCEEFTPQRAAYVAGYIVKKLTDRLNPMMANMEPEFSRQSNRPGLGAPFISLMTHSLKKWMSTRSAIDMPREIKIGHKTVPLDRYLLRRLREALSLDAADVQTAKDKESWERSIEMRFLLEEAQAASPGAVITATNIYHQQSSQKIKQRLHRYAIWQSQRTL